MDKCNLLIPLIDFDVHGESSSFVHKQTMLDYTLVYRTIKRRHYELIEEGSISSTSDIY